MESLCWTLFCRMDRRTDLLLGWMALIFAIRKNFPHHFSHIHSTSIRRYREVGRDEGWR